MKKDQEVVLNIEYSKPQFLKSKWFWFFTAVVLSVSAIIIYLIYQSNKLVMQFADGAKLSKEESIASFRGYFTDLRNYYNQANDLSDRYTLLLLGSDQVAGKDGDVELTDTIMLLQLDLNKAAIASLTLPRDIYHQDYQTKINALYHYGSDRYKDNPEQFTQEVIEEMTGVDIDRTVVLRMSDVEALIDLLGGIEVEVAEAFTDDLFPRVGVDVKTVRDPALLYETISFQAGSQTMDGATALKYMRSRHSGDSAGTDLARGQRQQAVIQALSQKLFNNFSPFELGELYRFYLDRFAKYLPMDDLLRLVAKFIQIAEQRSEYQLNFHDYQLSVFPADPEGLLINPPLYQSKNEWIYRIRNAEKFKEYFANIFN
jgi:LCP family protein required for cell wall assembly